MVTWPSGHANNYSARPTVHDLAYTDRPGEPVTIFTAREGLPVAPGRDWPWGRKSVEDAMKDGGVGVLVRPVSCGDDGGGGVKWLVHWGAGVWGVHLVSDFEGRHELMVSVPEVASSCFMRFVWGSRLPRPRNPRWPAAPAEPRAASGAA